MMWRRPKAGRLSAGCTRCSRSLRVGGACSVDDLWVGFFLDRGDDNVDALRTGSIEDEIGPVTFENVRAAIRAELPGLTDMVLDTETLALAERLEAFPVRITQLAHGLPVGVQLTGPAWSEARVLAAAETLFSATTSARAGSASSP